MLELKGTRLSCTKGCQMMTALQNSCQGVQKISYDQPCHCLHYRPQS